MTPQPTSVTPQRGVVHNPCPCGEGEGGVWILTDAPVSYRPSQPLGTEPSFLCCLQRPLNGVLWEGGSVLSMPTPLYAACFCTTVTRHVPVHSGGLPRRRASGLRAVHPIALCASVYHSGWPSPSRETRHQVVGRLNWMSPPSTFPAIVHPQIRTLPGVLPGDCPGASANVLGCLLPYVPPPPCISYAKVPN